MVEDEPRMDKGLREVQERVDGNEVINQDNSRPVLTIVLNTNNNEFKLECLQW